jgi:RNA polymerase sigma-70 factor, ECF subfamily
MVAPGPGNSARFRPGEVVTPAQAHPQVGSTASDEALLVARLRAGDEQAFETLVDEYYPMLLSVARGYVRSRAVAEEVVQEAWLGVLKGLDRFEGRSSLKTWIMRIVANIAMTRGTREARSQPFSSFAVGDDEPAVDADRFRDAGDGFAGHWRAYPLDWGTLPDGALLGKETLGVVMRAIDELPDAQRVVITMRDVAGCPAEEVCEALDVSEGNQRVLLHRARSRVRAALERHFDG